MRTLEWSVEIEVLAPSEAEPVAFDDVVGILDLLADRGVGGLTTDGEEGVARYGTRFCVDAEDAEGAVRSAVGAFRAAQRELGLPEWPTVRLEALTMEDLERDNTAARWPELLGVTELADLLGVSKQRASELARSTSFPPPLMHLASGPVWVRPVVERFSETWERRPGRPASAGVDRRGGTG